MSLLPACATSGSATQDAALKARLLRASRGLPAGTGYIQILKRARLGNFVEPVSILAWDKEINQRGPGQRKYSRVEKACIRANARP